MLRTYDPAPTRSELERRFRRMCNVELGAKGWTTLRFTWRRLTHREVWVANAVRTSARSTAE